MARATSATAMAAAGGKVIPTRPLHIFYRESLRNTQGGAQVTSPLTAPADDFDEIALDAARQLFAKMARGVHTLLLCTPLRAPACACGRRAGI